MVAREERSMVVQVHMSKETCENAMLDGCLSMRMPELSRRWRSELRYKGVDGDLDFWRILSVSIAQKRPS